MNKFIKHFFSYLHDTVIYYKTIICKCTFKSRNKIIILCVFLKCFECFQGRESNMEKYLNLKNMHKQCSTRIISIPRRLNKQKEISSFFLFSKNNILKCNTHRKRYKSDQKCFKESVKHYILVMFT